MEENHHLALLLHESATMSLVQYGTDALKFIGYGYLSFAAWDLHDCERGSVLHWLVPHSKTVVSCCRSGDHDRVLELHANAAH